ncbi:MAG: ArnT family glycosyltransferase [Fimbriimonadaceae bacterium]
MLGWLVVAGTIAGAPGVLLPVLRRHAGSLDPAAGVGLAGLASLGLLGTLTLFLGLGPIPLRSWSFVPVVWAIAGILLWLRSEPPRLSLPRGTGSAGLLLATVALLIALVGALAPCDSLDWDSLSYHLAVPKLWLESGRIERIPFIHHSNFPFAVDNLYIWGLAWVGESGAKLFNVGFLLYGMLAIFGLSRGLAGSRAAWWSVALFAGMPLVLWESGTGYIDVAHGLFAGLGAFLLLSAMASESRRGWAWIGGLLLGLAAGSKYTGLQAVGIAFLVALALAWRARAGGRAWVAALAVCIAVAAPWYVRNVAWSGNPVFPFFYERLGGAGWDERRAEIYRREQQTFGVGWSGEGLDKTAFGHAVLGLAYQPGRYVNPGQAEGRGFPIGAVGVAAVACLALATLLLARGVAPWPAVLVYLWLSLGAWFLLSQQSRYILGLAPVLALAAGELLADRRSRLLQATMRMVAAGQAAYGVALVYLFVASSQIPVVLGAVSRAEYVSARVPFARPATDINHLVQKGKVALYDEVFGFLLDVPYVWANPGHSTLIPYDDLQDGSQFAEAMRALGFSHVYVNLAYDGSRRARYAAVFNGARVPRDEDQFRNWELKWSELCLEALQLGELAPIRAYGDPEKPMAVLLAFR